MKSIKILIIIVLMSVVFVAKGQTDDALLDRIDFNDTTLIHSDFMWETIAEYITKAQNGYDMILATDNVLSRSVTSYTMYSAVYQYLISGFNELGVTMVVDYLIRMPHLEYLNPTDEQRDEITKIAESYLRVRIGEQSPDIQFNTIDKFENTLSKIESKNTIILFWSYSCPHCRDMLFELGKLIKNNKDLAVVTVCVSGDLKEVKRMLRKAGLRKQFNICDGMGWNSPIVEAYAVDMTPSLFLLDENKVLIAKPFDIEEVKRILQI